MSGMRSTLRGIIELVMFSNGILALFWVRYWGVKIHSRGEIAFWWLLLLLFAFRFLMALRDLLRKIQQKENPGSSGPSARLTR